MEQLPANAKVYYHSRTYHRLRKGITREHTLRSDTWLRLHLVDGALAWVDDRSHDRTVLGVGSRLDIPPSMPHHLEALARPATFSFTLFRVPAEELTAGELESGVARS